MKDYTRLPGTPEPMHRWQGFEGLVIAGDSWGDPNGPLVVLQHGGGQTRHAWQSAGEKLGAVGYRVVAYDARGHGDSAWAPDGDYSQDARLEDLKRILAELGSVRPVLVGASMGGGTSLVAVGENHIEAAALVLVDYAPNLDPAGVENIRTFMDKNLDGFETLEEVADAIASYQPHRIRQRDLDGLSKNVRLGDDGRYYWHWDPQAMRATSDREKRRVRLEACARNLSVPTLLVRGGLSDVLTEEGAARFCELCPRAEYVNVEGAAHMVAGDRNDVFSSAVIDFLSRTVPADRGGFTK
jgi:pimeloyl-ACP methyl ester carboxylesterase